MMTENPRLQIVGLGASTPIGKNIWSTAAAARAGICGFCEHPFMIDTAGEPMRIARVPWLDVDIEGIDRYCALLFPVIDEALVPVRNALQNRRIKFGIGLALPPFRPGQPAELSQKLIHTIASEYAGVFGRTQSFEIGHAAGHLALDDAINQCKEGNLDACVIAGVDSYLAPETLEWVEECDQLHGGGSMNNAWGFIPGEAASAILVATNTVCQQLGIEVFGEVVSVGVGQETKLIKTDAVCIGEGLTQAIRAALAALTPGEQIHNVFCDMNGEKYRADEYGFSTLRTKDWFRSASDFIALADCWGDVGAAGVSLHVAQAVIAHRKSYDKGSLSMVWASSESGERGAAVVRATKQGVS